ncbi:MAG: hypothetical protein WAS27_02720 [Candidatus Saccharimonadales bacterium]
MKIGSGLRKRQQIATTNRMMFLWVAVASIVVGFALVVSIFLWQKITFGEKVLAKKSETLATLDHNLKVVPVLRDNVRVLNTNEALKSTRINDADQPIQSVLDALPAGANSTALGSSLQARLLTGVEAVTLDTIRVDPVGGVETTADDVSEEAQENTITFTFTVSVPANRPDGLREILRRLERSIRAITVTSMTIEQQGSRLVLSVAGHAYYQPARVMQLKDTVVVP